MPNMGRGALIMKVAEARKMMPPGGEMEEMEEGGGFAANAKGHCEKGLAMAREYLDGEDGQASALRPKVEALVSAYEGLLSALNGEGGEEEA